MSNQPIPVDIENITGTGRLSGITFKEATQIPEPFRQLIPARAEAIPLFLRRSLPSVLGPEEVDLLLQAKDCVVDSDPSWTEADFLGGPIPPTPWLGLLHCEVSKRWGAHQPVGSIQHPSIPALRLPVWVISYWETMQQAIREWERWETAVKWVLQREESSHRAEVLEVIGCMPWGLELEPASVNEDPDRLAGNIADLLSWGWVRGTHLDIASELFNAACTTGWFAGDSYLAIHLISIKDLPDEEILKDKTLLTVMELVKYHNARRIVFPVNVNNTHWFVAHIDLDKKRYSHGACYILSHCH